MLAIAAVMLYLALLDHSKVRRAVAIAGPACRAVITPPAHPPKQKAEPPPPLVNLFYWLQLAFWSARAATESAF